MVTRRSRSNTTTGGILLVLILVAIHDILRTSINSIYQVWGEELVNGRIRSALVFFFSLRACTAVRARRHVGGTQLSLSLSLPPRMPSLAP